MNKLELLEHWEHHYSQIYNAYKLISLAFDVDCDAPSIAPTFEMFDTYTDVVAELVGDKHRWLEWYAFENDFGKKGMGAKGETWPRIRPVKDLKTLLELIEDTY